jgi:hypothetical protein
MDEVKDGAYNAMIEAYRAKDKVNLANWRANPKMKEIKFSQADLDKFREKGGKPIWEQWVKENKQYVPHAQELIDLVLKTASSGN